MTNKTAPANPTPKPISWYARRYVERFGFHLVPIEPLRKFPRSGDWGNNCITDADAAEDYYARNPDWNMGVALGPSRMCSLDIDCADSFRLICECFGLDLDALIAETPTIQGASKGVRLMFRIPDGVDLPYHKLNWRSRNDPTGDKHKAAMAAAKAAREAGDKDREARIRAVAKRWAMYTVFELRASEDGKQRQDVLPPSVHPDTGLPYRWETQPRETWPEPPTWLVSLWQDWEPFKRQMTAMCPWSVVEEVKPAKVAGKPAVQYTGDSIIESYTRETAIEQALADYGYRQIGKRWLSPHSSTGLPGVVILPGKNSCWIHHASDPLCSEETGRPVNAFDLMCYYEHGGDVRRAVADIRGDAPAVVRSEPAQGQGGAPTHSQAQSEAPSRDLMSPLPWSNDKGRPLKHIDNLREICRRLGVTVRYNVIRKDEEILIPDQGFSMDNEANASLAWLTSECSLYQFPTDKLGDFITYLADQNPYNPVARWIDSKPWDGVNRLAALFDTVTARGQASNPDIKALKETLIKRWMISAVAGAYSPTGVSAAGVLVFQGAQYLGKTKWFKTLVPPEMGLLKDGMLLRPDDKDSVKQACSFWLVELGELDATFRKSDIAALKSFITNDSDVLRRAYARRESHFARRTVFFGSVNPREFLHDPTGNRRYWTIECEHLVHSHNIDMQQVWAQVKAIWEDGEGYYLTPQEMDALNGHNADFMALDPIEEKILGGLAWDAPQSEWRWAQASAVLAEVGIDRPSRPDAATASTLIRSRNGDQVKKSNGKKLLLCPPVPLKIGY